MIDLRHDDCRIILATLPDASVDAIITDPPYEQAFMGAAWDATGIAYDPTVWRECLRVLKPGGHLAAFGGTRTHHRLASVIEDAGFEIRDSLMWIYGQGFPKGIDVSKAIDKAAGATREPIGPNPQAAQQTAKYDTASYGDFHGAPTDLTAPATDAARRWQGWNTSLKPACEPIVLARKPLGGSRTVVLTPGDVDAWELRRCARA